MKTNPNQCQASRCNAPVEPGKFMCERCLAYLPHSRRNDLERIDYRGWLEVPAIEDALPTLEILARCVDLVAAEAARLAVVNPYAERAAEIRRELRKGVAVE